MTKVAEIWGSFDDNKHPNLSVLVKAALALSHGNTVSDQMGVSVNNSVS